MTQKIYKSAMGKTVDLGALMLENENVRAVGNMSVNARGDTLDGNNRVIEPKNSQIKKQNSKRTVNTSSIPVSSGTQEVRQQLKKLQTQKKTKSVIEEKVEQTISDDCEVVESTEPAETISATPAPRGGLAAAIAKAQTVKQELMKTPRQIEQERSGVKRI